MSAENFVNKPIELFSKRKHRRPRPIVIIDENGGVAIISQACIFKVNGPPLGIRYTSGCRPPTKTKQP